MEARNSQRFCYAGLAQREGSSSDTAGLMTAMTRKTDAFFLTDEETIKMQPLGEGRLASFRLFATSTRPQIDHIDTILRPIIPMISTSCSLQIATAYRERRSIITITEYITPVSECTCRVSRCPCPATSILYREMIPVKAQPSSRNAQYCANNDVKAVMPEVRISS